MTAQYPDLFIVLTGGTGRRLGGRDKASIDVGDGTLFDHAIRGAAGRPVVVVGPRREGPDSIRYTREDPPGGGPAAGIAAGVRFVTDGDAGGLALRADGPGAGGRAGEPDAVDARAGEGLLVALLAVDQVGVDPDTWRRLAAAIRGAECGVVLVADGRRQYGVGVYRLRDLARACARRPSWQGRPLKELLDPLIGVEVEATGEESQDIDTLGDLHSWLARSHAHPARGRADDEGIFHDDADEPRGE